MKTATVRDAQHHLSKLLVEVSGGEEIVLTKRGEAVARLIPVSSEDPFGAEVSWKDSIRQRNEALSDLPKTTRNPVIEMREDERY